MRLGRLRDGNVTRSRTRSATSSWRNLPVSPGVVDPPAEAGRDRSGHDVADPDVVVPNFLHQRFAERVQSRLRCAVRRAPHERVLARKAADVDDPSSAAALEMGKRGGAAVEDAAEVRVDDVLPVAGRHVGDVREVADSGVVHEHVEPAEALDCSVDRAAGFVRLPDVCAHGERRIFREPCGSGVEMLLIASCNHHPGAPRDERGGDRQPDPARTTRHNGDGRGQSRATLRFERSYSCH